jgi:hypothetical protein
VAGLRLGRRREDRLRQTIDSRNCGSRTPASPVATYPSSRMRYPRARINGRLGLRTSIERPPASPRPIEPQRIRRRIVEMTWLATIGRVGRP